MIIVMYDISREIRFTVVAQAAEDSEGVFFFSPVLQRYVKLKGQGQKKVPIFKVQLYLWLFNIAMENPL